MMTLTNLASGELLIGDHSGRSVRFNRDQANRLILTARMHSVQEFVQKLPTLIGDTSLLNQILALFDHPDSSARWHLKEKFARLETLEKDYQSTEPEKVVERVEIE